MTSAQRPSDYCKIERPPVIKYSNVYPEPPQEGGTENNYDEDNYYNNDDDDDDDEEKTLLR